MIGKKALIQKGYLSEEREGREQWDNFGVREIEKYIMSDNKCK